MHYLIDEGVRINRIFEIGYAIGAATSHIPSRFAWDACRIMLAVQEPLDARRCLAAYRRLQNFSNEQWDALEPHLVEEIAVLNELCDLDEDDD